MSNAAVKEMPTTCPWDPERLAMVASSPARAMAILDMLLQQGEKTIATMQLAWADARVKEWRRAAHGLAGSALNLGMEPLAGYCREDEQSTATEAQRYELCEAIRAELQRIAAHRRSLEH